MRMVIIYFMRVPFIFVYSTHNLRNITQIGLPIAIQKLTLSKNQSVNLVRDILKSSLIEKKKHTPQKWSC